MTTPAPGRVAIITGASQGIGAGLVTAYRQLGFAVIANSRSIAESSDSLTVAVAGDVADPTVCERPVQTAVDRFGRVDAAKAPDIDHQTGPHT